MLGKLVFHSLDDVLPLDADMLIPVSATLFVPETKGVEQFMEDHTMVDTAGSKRQQLELRLDTNTAVATITREDVNKIWL